jgi:NAD(P)-dependent dehydrogenase (short-subunit alcohol dehydrogenase family)
MQTGGNRGIGLEIVKALLETAPSADTGSGAPFHVYLGSRDLQKGEDVAAKLATTHGNTVSAVQLDITSPESVGNAVAAVKAGSGRLDVLINNAGVNLDDIPDEATKMRTLYEINVIGTWRLTDAFKSLLLTQPGGEGGGEGKEKGTKTKTKRIIHVTSSMGSTTSRFNPEFAFYGVGYTPYRCTKAALGMLTACHAYEFKDDGVKVHAFDPGLAATEFGGGNPEVMRKLGAVEPRVSGLACRDVVLGKRDDESRVIVSINGDTYPW